MSFSFKTTKGDLKVLSGVCSNLVVFWVVGVFSSQNLGGLTRNLIAAILTWKLAAWLENVIDNND